MTHKRDEELGALHKFLSDESPADTHEDVLADLAAGGIHDPRGEIEELLSFVKAQMSEARKVPLRAARARIDERDRTPRGPRLVAYPSREEMVRRLTSTPSFASFFRNNRPGDKTDEEIQSLFDDYLDAEGEDDDGGP